MKELAFENAKLKTLLSRKQKLLKFAHDEIHYLEEALLDVFNQYERLKLLQIARSDFLNLTQASAN